LALLGYSFEKGLGNPDVFGQAYELSGKGLFSGKASRWSTGKHPPGAGPH